MSVTETPTAPPKCGAIDLHSGRRTGGVEVLEGGNQDSPKTPAKEKNRPEK